MRVPRPAYTAYTRRRPGDEGTEEGAGKGEIWKPLLIALLVLAGLELLLSWKFGDYT